MWRRRCNAVLKHARSSRPKVKRARSGAGAERIKSTLAVSQSSGIAAAARAGNSSASPAGDDRVNSGVEQELHLQPLEPAGQGFLIASRPGPGAEVDHGLGVPCVAACEPRGPAVVAMPFQDWPGRLGKRAEDGMAADPAKPVGGIAGIGLATMSDAVPVG